MRKCLVEGSSPYKAFKDLEGAREWGHNFVTWYNTKHRHNGKAKELLSKRKKTLEEVKKCFPTDGKTGP